MKAIIRTTLTLIALLIGMHSYAQDNTSEEPPTPPKVSFGVRAGINFSNLTTVYEGNTYSDKIRVGYNIGALMDIHLSKQFYIRSGLSLSSKGTKIEDFGFEEISDSRFTSNMEAIYIQLPVYFLLKKEVYNNKNKLSIAGGPYFAYGVAGKTKFVNKSGPHFATTNTFGENMLWNRPDIGLGIEISFEIQRLVFTYGGEMGFAKTLKTGYPYLLIDAYYRNNTNFFSVGLNF